MGRWAVLLLTPAVARSYDSQGNVVEATSLLPEGAGLGDCPEDGMLPDRFSCKPECRGSIATNSCVLCFGACSSDSQPCLAFMSLLPPYGLGNTWPLVFQLTLDSSLALPAQVIRSYVMSSGVTTDTFQTGTPVFSKHVHSPLPWGEFSESLCPLHGLPTELPAASKSARMTSNCTTGSVSGCSSFSVRSVAMRCATTAASVVAIIWICECRSLQSTRHDVHSSCATFVNRRVEQKHRAGRGNEVGG